MADLDSTTALCKVLADPTRVRLLALLSAHTLTVAEITQVTGLPQPRISTHLRTLRDAGLAEAERTGGSSYYTRTGPQRLVDRVLQDTQDPLIEQDHRRAEDAIAKRSQGWVDGVAGRMSRHYSPGRTWSSLARGLVGLSRHGAVVDLGSGDGSVAEMLAPFCESVVCVDLSPSVVNQGQQRLAHLSNLRFQQSDLHALPFADQTFQLALLLGSLPYSPEPQAAVNEAARVLSPGGRLVVSTLQLHTHGEVTERYGHVNAGCTATTLQHWLQSAGLRVEQCGLSSRERRAPHFSSLTAFASKPE